jgi:hypothetical protein
MKQLLAILLCVISVNQLYAQDADCKVLSDSLKGKYTGECNNGKANGTGKAVGVHTYEGDFKNGLPEGNGKYTWSNGDYYYGGWKKGLKDGKGELHRFEEGTEKLVTGYWKKGNYKGEYENPYVIYNNTPDIGRIEVTKINDKEFTIAVTVENLLGGGNPGTTHQGTTVMTSNQVTRGSYVSKSNNVLTNKEITSFRGVVFPFRAILNFGNTMIDIEFFEQGAWDIRVPINK